MQRGAGAVREVAYGRRDREVNKEGRALHARKWFRLFCVKLPAAPCCCV